MFLEDKALHRSLSLYVIIRVKLFVLVSILFSNSYHLFRERLGYATLLLQRFPKKQVRARTFPLCECLMLFFFISLKISYANLNTPKTLDNRFKIELVAKEPDIVTPVGACFNHKGQLLVIESHTHLAKGKQPFPHDRIRILSDSDDDGIPDKFDTFYEGCTNTMSLIYGKGNWLYVATRQKIFRIKDTDDDHRADIEETIITLETSEDYPHNGLAGVCFDRNGKLHFGFGENMGKPYEIYGTDLICYKGHGDGGSIYQCDPDGKNLKQIATGFWNPFSMCFDSAGRLFAVDNDPDSRPPCRLLHIVPGADFGYQVRYGRKGTHPMQSWNGELPGTQGMVCGTGEAPSGIIDYHGMLLGTSWGHHTIEHYEISPKGATWTGHKRIIVQGNGQFRPVDFALAPDNSIYITDWVDTRYPVHGKGRIWRLSWIEQSLPKPSFAHLTKAEEEAQIILQTHDHKTLLAALSHEDPTIRTAARWQLQNDLSIEQINLSSLPPQQRFGLYHALRKQFDLGKHSLAKRDELLRTGLQDPDTNIQFLAVQWIADHHLKEYEKDLEFLLKNNIDHPYLFKATLAAISLLEGAKANNFNIIKVLFNLLEDDKQVAKVGPLALSLFPPHESKLTLARLKELTLMKDPQIVRQATRILALRGSNKNPDEETMDLLADIAKSNPHPEAQADALMALALSSKHQALVEQFAHEKSPKGREAKRLIDWPPSDTRPTPNDLEQWVREAAKGGNADAGWRIFYSPRGGTCATCHTYNGRGIAIGPDLTGIARNSSMRSVIRSILDPNVNISPQHTHWTMETKSGQTKIGIPLDDVGGAGKERYVGPDGETFILRPNEITSKTMATHSLMPPGLLNTISLQDFRDLMAFLQAEN